MNDSTVFIKMLDDLTTSYLNDLGGFFLIAKLIAGLGLFISVYFAFFELMDGSNEAISKFLKKFILIFLGISYYTTFISFINFPLDKITEVTRKVAVDDYDTTIGSNLGSSNSEFQLNTKYDEKIAQNVEWSDGQEDQSILGQVSSKVINTVSNGFQNIITVFLTAVAELAIIILSVIRGFFLIVLSLFGIFVIALSAFPTLEGSFTQWLTKYINVYLWLPIGYILQSIISKLDLIQTTKDINVYEADSTSYSLLISVCTILGYFTIPTLSSWMVSAATTGGTQKMSSGAREVAKVAANVASGGTAGSVAGGVAGGTV